MTAPDTHRTIDAIWRIESAKLIGALARKCSIDNSVREQEAYMLGQEPQAVSAGRAATNQTAHAAGVFEGKSWDEKAFGPQVEGQKQGRASVVNAYRGDIEGEGTLEYLMFYETEQRGTFFGLERVVGRLGGRSGSFVLQHSGIFDGGTVQATWSVVRDSGTGELRGLTGDGGFLAKHGENETRFTLDYSY